MTSVETREASTTSYRVAQCTVRRPGMGTQLMGTILRFASIPLKKIGTLLLGSWWP